MEHQHIFQTILTYLHHNPQFGMWFAFLVAFSESLPIFGTLIPGTITMTVVGILVGSGGLPLLPTLWVTSIAAFCGDTIGYFCGILFNDRIRTMWPFKHYQKWLNIGEKFFKKHGGKSIIIGRFFGPARSTVPLVAGLLKLTWLRFTLAAIPSAVMWAALYLTPGFLLGALSREIPKEETTRFLIYGVVTLFLLFGLIWLIQHFFTQLSRGMHKLSDNCWNALTRYKTGKKFLVLITDSHAPNSHHPMMLLLFALFSALLFLGLFLNMAVHGVLMGLNISVFHLLQSIRTPHADNFFTLVTLIGEPTVVACITLLMALCFYLKKQPAAAVHLILALILTAGAIFTCKHLLYIPRPTGFVFVKSSSSFPSGHTTMSFTLFTFIAFLFAENMQGDQKKYRFIPYVLALLLSTFVLFSRLYLGRHWIGDIIGSVLISTSIVLICIISYQHFRAVYQKNTLSFLQSCLMVIVSFAIPLGYFIPHLFEKTRLDATPLFIKQTTAIDNWWNDPFRHTPVYRNNRLGKPFQPFNIQWQGSPRQLETLLEQHGWEHINSREHLKSALAGFASDDAKYHMPLLPWLYNNKPPVLVMIKHIPMQKRIIELHLWESELHFPGTQQALWIGTVDIRIPPKVLLSIKDYTKISLADNGGLDELANDIAPCQHKYVTENKTAQPKKIQLLHWNGKILLVRCQ